MGHFDLDIDGIVLVVTSWATSVKFQQPTAGW
jgi:hypothetical protein